MGRVNIYIRDSDIDTWRVIPNKSEWLHQMLSGTLTEKKLDEAAAHIDAVATKFVPKPPDPNTGYPCCQSATHRCKHWVWDTNEAIYRNTLTNKTMEASL